MNKELELELVTATARKYYNLYKKFGTTIKRYHFIEKIINFCNDFRLYITHSRRSCNLVHYIYKVRKVSERIFQYLRI